MLYVDYYKSPIGKLILIAENDSLIAIHFENSRYLPSNMENAIFNSLNPTIDRTKQWLQEYFLRKIPSFTPKIKLSGSNFGIMVWKHLLEIPYGKTCSYGELAKTVARKMKIERMSAQAIGQATGRNPISIIVPCHRVVGSKGKLTGYAGGLDKKKFLLELEGRFL